MHYLRRRAQELASPTTRSITDPLADWAARKIRLEGKPFRFEDHEYLRAIYDDTSPHIVLSKAAQIGGTTWAILRSIHACISGLHTLYFFPTRTDVLDFSRSRVSPLIQENRFLAKLVNDTDTAGLKKIGEAYLYMRGMQSTVGMKSVPADLLIFDELDEAAPAAKAMAMERLAHSDFKRVIELSNPSLPDYGIDEQFQKSDQSYWTMKCRACNTWTCLEQEFPKKLGQEVTVLLPRKGGGVYRACPKCSRELDTEVGEWVPQFPDRKIKGYRISQLFSAKVGPEEILTEYRTTRYPDRFYNLKIGIPWADLSRRVDSSSVLALCSDRMPGWYDERSYLSMGVDTGRELHVVIVERPREDSVTPRLVEARVCHTFDELDALMEKFTIRRCVIDGLPETHPTREFAHRHRGRVFMCFFNEHQRGAPNFDWKGHSVAVNRTEAIDMSRAAIREEKIVLPRRDAVLEEFAHHMSNDAKVLDEDEETGIRKYRYIRTGVNHFSMAFTYAWMSSATRPLPPMWLTESPI